MFTIKRLLTTIRYGLVLSLFAWATGTMASPKVTSKALGGEERYLVYASTDKPVYREGESVYVRAVFLNAADNTPLKESHVNAAIKIRGPKGDIVFSGFNSGSDSSAGFQWEIPAGTAGGQYTALINSSVLGVPETERMFEVRAYRAPRLKSQITFTREGYGPGELVQVSVKTDRAEGGIPIGAKVTAVARVDGKEVFKKTGLTIAKDGTSYTEFLLPETIAVGDGNLSFIIEDGGVVETASKTLPIILQTMDIAFYPEGGDMVAGLQNRIYVQANRPDGKPADIEGRIFALKNGKLVPEAVARVKTQHEGRGTFNFTPVKNTHYVLVLDTPSSIHRQFPLPKSRRSGTIIKSLQPVYSQGENIAVEVSSSTKNNAISLTLHKREVLLDTQAITSAVAGKATTLSLSPQDSEGVLIVTAWDAQGKPLAERLVYREPRFAVNIDIKAGEESFIPGQRVSLDITTTDANGKPVEAVVGLTVTDDAVLELIEKREQAPRLPVMVYLENEVRDLADAHVYLDASNAKAPEALDLLLGTQGWRRFILVEYDKVKQNFLEDSKRVLAEKAPIRIVPRMARMLKNQAMVAGIEEIGVEAAALAADNVQVFKEGAAPVEPPLDKQLIERAENNVPADRVQAPKPILVEQEEKRFANADRAMDEIAIRGEIAPHGMVREYAHQVRANRKANDRIDFSETLYWHAGIRTDARDGKAKVEFDLSDSVTAFRVMGDAFGRNGALGSNDLLINSVEPFYIEPKMPLEVTAGDRIELPVSLVNASDEKIDIANLLVRGEGLDIIQARPTALTAGARERRIVNIVANKPGRFPLILTAAAGPYSDKVTRTLVVKPRGFPIAVNEGGLVGPQTQFSTEITIPQEIEAGSLTSIIKVYPSPLANMEEALNALLREPYGCFEQTSSSNYPLVMAQQYFTSHQGIAPEKINRARKLLDAGYKKLIGFESKDKGYEWFGANPAHEALTAYGLMEFVDMAKVMPVDEAMIQRTRDWLLQRRDGKGSFKRNERALDSFGRAPAPTTDAYIVWSLLESGEDPSTLRKEIAAIKKQAFKSDDSYIIALAANILYLSDDYQAATQLSEKLAKAVAKNGAINGGETSITRSGGDALTIETTSLTLLVWLRDDERWAAHIERSMKWLFERSKAGRFGSTQSTILALKAINAYDSARATPKQPGSVQLLVNGKIFGHPVHFDKTSKGAIELPDFSAALVAGDHRIELRMEDGSKMPFSLEVQYNTRLPAISSASEITLSSQLSASTIGEGEPLELNATIRAGDKDAPTPIAILGVPAGAEVRHDQLKELVGADRISAYEVRGREVILYWRALKAGEQRVIPISLTAAVPGTFTSPASRAYLYYTDEHKHWEKGHQLTIHPR